MNKFSNTMNPQPSPNKLLEDVEVNGIIKFKKSLEFNGSITGKIESKGTLIVGQKGLIDGEIDTQSVEVHGTILGNISAKEKCILKSTASIAGDIESKQLSMEEGAEFTGASKVS